jgi:hypothetical protein
MTILFTKPHKVILLFRNLAHKEKMEKENRRFMGRKMTYMQLSDKYGLSAAVARKRAGLPPLTPMRWQ